MGFTSYLKAGELKLTGVSPVPEGVKALFPNIEEFPGSAPIGWREIDVQEYASTFRHHRPIGVLYLGYLLRHDAEGNDLPDNLAIFYQDNTGLALSFDTTPKKGQYGGYEYQPRYFAFGCEHTPKEYGRDEAKANGWPYTSGNCFHNARCTKCGAGLSYDSGD
jgi:hypothetical protein